MNVDNVRSQMRKGMLEYCILLLLHKEPIICFGYHSKIERSPAHCSRRDALSAAYPAEKR